MSQYRHKEAAQKVDRQLDLDTKGTGHRQVFQLAFKRRVEWQGMLPGIDERFRLGPGFGKHSQR